MFKTQDRFWSTGYLIYCTVIFWSSNAFSYCEFQVIKNLKFSSFSSLPEKCVALAYEQDKFEPQFPTEYVEGFRSEFSEGFSAVLIGKSVSQCQNFCSYHREMIAREVSSGQRACEVRSIPLTIRDLPIQNIKSIIEKFAFIPDLGTTQKFTELLLNKIVAVHATSYFPENAKIRIARKTSLEAGFRPKIHFSLGGLIPSFTYNDHPQSWEDKPLAILVPLKDTIPQLVNLNLIDTTLLGDFTLPQDAILVANQKIFTPDHFKRPEFRDKKIVYFNPENEKLGDVVDRVLKEEKKWLLRNNIILYPSESAKSSYVGTDLGKNLNSLGFFGVIFKLQKKML